VARFVGAVKAARSNFPHGDFSMTTLSVSRKTLLSLFAASAVSMTSLAFAQTAATAPDVPPAAATPTPHEGPMQEGVAAPAPNMAPAPMASTDKPKSWKELDTNKDGKLGKDEVAGDATWTADFDTADANKDGYLSKSEFKKHEADLKKVASNEKK
jgi:hypothetical protein